MIYVGEGLALILAGALLLKLAHVFDRHSGQHHRGALVGAASGGDAATMTVSIDEPTIGRVEVPVYPIERPPADVTVIDLPVITDDDDFYVEDEPAEELESVLARADRVLTAPPEGWTGPVYDPPALSAATLPPEPEVGPDPDPDATGDFPVVTAPTDLKELAAAIVNEPPATLPPPDDDAVLDPYTEADAATTAEFRRFWSDADELDVGWFRRLSESSYEPATRRLKQLMSRRGWVPQKVRERRRGAHGGRLKRAAARGYAGARRRDRRTTETSDDLPE